MELVLVLEFDVPPSYIGTNVAREVRWYIAQRCSVGPCARRPKDVAHRLRRYTIFRSVGLYARRFRARLPLQREDLL